MAAAVEGAASAGMKRRGITILPQSAALIGHYSDDSLITRPFMSPAPKRTVALAWRASFPRHKAIDALRKAISQCNLGG